MKVTMRYPDGNVTLQTDDERKATKAIIDVLEPLSTQERMEVIAKLREQMDIGAAPGNTDDLAHSLGRLAHHPDGMAKLDKVIAARGHGIAVGDQ